MNCNSSLIATPVAWRCSPQSVALRFRRDAGRMCGLLTLIALWELRPCGVEHEVLGPLRHFGKLANCFCRQADVSIRLDMHCSGQSAKRHLKGGDAFRLSFYVCRTNHLWCRIVVTLRLSMC